MVSIKPPSTYIIHVELISWGSAIDDEEAVVGIWGVGETISSVAVSVTKALTALQAL